MKKYTVFCAVALLAVVLGCVIRTEHKIDAHITLDIRHIADQAEDVLDFIEGKKDELPGLEGAPEPVSHIYRFFNALSPMQTAHASSLEVTTSPRVREIAVSMRERNPKVEAFKRRGCIGENNRGYVELRDCDTIQTADERNEAQELIADENRDRQALYSEIARLNRDTPGVTVAKVESIYAMERLRRARSGDVFQLPPAGEQFDAVKGSPLGRSLGDDCKPNAWVVIP